MQPSKELISYRLPDGHIFEYTLDHEKGVSTSDIDGLVCAYFEHTHKVPDMIFIRHDLFTGYLHRIAVSARFVGGGAPPNPGLSSITMWLSLGQIPVTTIMDAYIPILVGTQADYDDNNLNWIFEETVLAGCESE
jgi:hypothetical protein